MTSKTIELKVKEHFNNSDTYLLGNDGIRIRSESVQEFAGHLVFHNILDLACGNGMISLPLLNDNNKLTLLDISSNMLLSAQANIPQGKENQVILIESSISEAGLPTGSYDLVLCLGLLAHLPDPLTQLSKYILPLIIPGGHIIIQNTDSHHPYTWFSHDLASAIKRTLGLQSYRMNRISNKKLEALLRNQGFILHKRFHYVVSFPLIGRLMRNGGKGNLIRFIFGTVGHKRRQFMGNDCLFHFVKDK